MHALLLQEAFSDLVRLWIPIPPSPSAPMPLSAFAVSGIKTASLGASWFKANVSYPSSPTVNTLHRPGHGTAHGDASCLGQV